MLCFRLCVFIFFWSCYPFTFSLAQCRTTRTTTTDDDRLCKIKKKTEATHLRCARFLSPRLRSRLRLVFSVGKNIILPFVKLNVLSFFLLYPVRENEISHDENWGVRGVREWVEVWGVGAVQARNIYIYIFIIQKLLRGSRAATRSLFAVMEWQVVGVGGGDGLILASSAVSSFCPAALQLQINRNKTLLVKSHTHTNATIHHAADKLYSRCDKHISLQGKKRYRFASRQKSKQGNAEYQHKYNRNCVSNSSCCHRKKIIWQLFWSRNVKHFLVRAS